MPGAAPCMKNNHHDHVISFRIGDRRLVLARGGGGGGGGGLKRGHSEVHAGKGYFKQDKSDAAKLPFKWMAPPESLRDGLFTEKSDVVNYVLVHAYSY